MRTRIVATCAVVLVVLAGCSSGDHGTMSGSGSGAPKPADVAAASRTIDVNAGAGLKFDPASVSVNRGETVAFKVVNPDQIAHEFQVGDVEFQNHHIDEMKDKAPGEGMPDEPTGFSLKPGETKTVALTFPDAGTFLYGCHEPGHYDAGMKGEIKVT